MKILWVNCNFLHPTTKGGQIRTLEMLRCLHQNHQIHYVAFDNPAEPEGVERAGEYSTRAYPVRNDAPPKGTLGFALQAAWAPLDSQSGRLPNRFSWELGPSSGPGA